MEGLVSEYLAKIGASRTDSIEVLIDKHLKTFFYCNVWLWAEGRKPVGERKVLASDDVFGVWEDLKRDGFGYCFQLIELQKAVLEHLGHPTTRHASVPVNQRSDLVEEVDVLNKLGFRHAHELLKLEDGGIVDVGYGPNALTNILRCPIGGEAKCGDNNYRITPTREKNWCQLEVELPAGWWALYRFCLEPTDQVQWMAKETLLTPSLIRIRDEYLYIAKVFSGRRKWLLLITGGSAKVEGKLGGLWKVIADGKPLEERWIEKWEDAQELLMTELNWKVDERLRPLFL